MGEGEENQRLMEEGRTEKCGEEEQGGGRRMSNRKRKMEEKP